jgi:hypothetical protein
VGKVWLVASGRRDTCYPRSSAIRSPIAMQVRLMAPAGTVGIKEASATCRREAPLTAPRPVHHRHRVLVGTHPTGARRVMVGPDVRPGEGRKGISSVGGARPPLHGDERREWRARRQGPNDFDQCQEAREVLSVGILQEPRVDDWRPLQVIRGKAERFRVTTASELGRATGTPNRPAPLRQMRSRRSRHPPCRPLRWSS